MTTLTQLKALSGPTADLLWLIKSVNLPTPVTEFLFAQSIGRRWRFDIAFVPSLVAVEIDGGAWVNGRHTTGSGFEADCLKLSTAAAMGWRVLRVTPRMIRDGIALELVEQALR